MSSDNDWVLEKHLAHLASTQPCMEFKVYAAANRPPARYHSLLRSRSFIEVVPLPSIAERESAEHGTYLDMLVAHALADGCDYICTFDADSWPIQDDWIRIAHACLVESSTVAAAVHRAENGDTILPHPSFSFLEAGLFRDPDCRYWISEEERSASFRKFLWTNRQHGDTVALLGYFLESRGRPWVRLHQSNRKDLHYLMAGIYADFIFHVGASSRKELVFRRDDAAWAINLTRPIASTPVLWRIQPALRKLLKSTYEPSVRRKNRRVFDAIAKRLTID